MKADVLRVVAVLAAAYPSANFTEATVSVWADMLQDLDPAALEAAARSLILERSSGFAPSIGEVRARAIGAPEAREYDALASDAWAAVKAEVDRVGYPGVPQFRDAVTERAVHALGSWYAFCTCDESELPSHRARFIAAYNSARHALDSRALLPEDLRRQVEARREAFLAGGPTRPALPDREPSRLASALTKYLSDGDTR